jgi:prepilin-type N-terminal cleavage/methylation domain-containing protein
MLHLAPRRVSRLSGFTLIEVVLVLSLLVVIFAVSVPYLGSSFSRANLSGAADLVRGALARSRVKAMESGRAQVFRCERDNGEYKTIALADLELQNNSSGVGGNASYERANDSENREDENSSGDSSNENSPSDILRLEANRLPSDVKFAAVEVASSTMVAAIYGTAGDDSWSDPIVFNPDGTSSDASILLQNDREQTIRVTLRGLTGVATAGDIGSEEVQ